MPTTTRRSAPRPRRAPLTKGPASTGPAYRGRLTLETPLGALLSDSRIRLLEAIDRLGSLNQAARHVPLSYKAAWDAMDLMNRQAPEPLVLRSTGGAGGGGTRLTPYGKHVVALYRAMESSQQDILDRLDPGAGGDDVGALRTQIKRSTMRSSARNQWSATVAALHDRGGLVDVVLRVGDASRPDTFIATITPESARAMALALGTEVHALLKAPAIEVLAGRPSAAAGTNLLQGTVAALRPAEASTGVTLTLASGQPLHAVVPNAQGSRLAVGASAWARFSGEHVILVIFV